MEVKKRLAAHGCSCCVDESTLDDDN